MYTNKEEARVGDIVQGYGGEGEVLDVVPNGISGEMATVRWTTPLRKVPGINSALAPSTVSTQLLTLLRRKTG